MGRQGLVVLSLATLLAGCPVDLGWDVDQGDLEDASVRIRLLPFFLVDRDKLDDPDASGLFALHSTATFLVENPHDHWDARNGAPAAEPADAVTFSAVSPSDNVLTFDARFETEGLTRLQVRRRTGALLDERPLRVAKATSNSRLRRYADTVLTPDAPDLGDTLDVAEGGQIGVLVDWRDDLDQRLLGKRLLHLDVDEADEAIVKVVDRARDGGTENTWGDWFDFVAVLPGDHAGVVRIAAGPDTVRTVDVRVHAVDDLDDVVLAPVDVVVAGDTDAVTATWLTATAVDDGDSVLAAPLQWYQGGVFVGEGTFAQVWDDGDPAQQRIVIVCVGTTHVTWPDRPLDTGTPDTDATGDTDLADTVVDTEPADTDAGDTAPADTVVADSEPPAPEPADTDPGVGPFGSGLRGVHGEPCARLQIQGGISEVQDDRYDPEDKPKKCGACDTSAGAISGGALLFAVLGRRRRRARS